MTKLTKEEAKKSIVDAIVSNQGCKATQLVVYLEQSGVDLLSRIEQDIPTLVEELVKEGELIEVEYSVPTLNWRAKSFLLPKGSSVTIRRM